MTVRSLVNTSRMSKPSRNFSVTLCAIVLLCLTGCGRGNPFDLVPVSGTVTIDGQPAANIVVLFTPVANDTTSIVGPFSSSVTDAEGKFTLKSKQRKPGAVPGDHSVSLQYRSFNPEAVANLKQQIQQAKQSGGDVAAAKAALKEAQAQPQLPQRYSGIRVTVGKDGLSDHKFDLASE